MENNDDTREANGGPGSRAAVNVGAFLIVFLFVWLVFDNIALGLIAGLMFGGASAGAQRAAAGKRDSGDARN